ncbi:MAG: cobalt transporter subunit CbtA [Oleiphilaceae bacterium]|jgi:cobalt transporter subunit CbtA
MLFRRIIFSAMCIGLLSGLLFSVVQYFGVSPIILAAEQYEIFEDQAAPVESHHHGEELSGGHHHNTEAWSPSDGIERSLYSLLSNVLAGIGFAAIVLSIMCQLQLKGWVTFSPMKGLIFGLAGFLAFFAMPGIGLPPEIPGIEAAPLDNRQTWWLLSVIVSGLGLGILALAKWGYKILGVLCIALPFLVGAPHSTGPEFGQADERVVAILMDLHQQFILASGMTNLVFWLALGLLCAWGLNRMVLHDDIQQPSA